jgi:hypothetical protein
VSVVTAVGVTVAVSLAQVSTQAVESQGVTSGFAASELLHDVKNITLARVNKVMNFFILLFVLVFVELERN